MKEMVSEGDGVVSGDKDDNEGDVVSGGNEGGDNSVDGYLEVEVVK